VSVTCILCTTRRELPRGAGATIGVDHVNAGVTYLSDGGHIMVVRAEHAHKVLLHELVHCLGLDGALHGGGRAVEERLARELAYVPSPVVGMRGGEAYAEVLACFWHMYLCYAMGKRKLGLGAYLERAWRSERALFRATCAAIWAHMHADRGGKEGREGREGGTRREDTHVLAYYFGKAGLWDALDRVPTVLSLETAPLAPQRFWDLLYCVLRPGAPLWSDVVASASASMARTMTTTTKTTKTTTTTTTSDDDDDDDDDDDGHAQRLLALCMTGLDELG